MDEYTEKKARVDRALIAFGKPDTLTVFELPAGCQALRAYADSIIEMTRESKDSTAKIIVDAALAVWDRNQGECDFTLPEGCEEFSEYAADFVAEREAAREQQWRKHEQNKYDAKLQGFREKHLPSYVAALLSAVGGATGITEIHVIAESSIEETFTRLHGERPE